MAVGLDADGDALQRTGIPSGGAGTLSDGAFTNTGIGVWCYRPTSGNTYGTTAGGPIIHQKSGARECGLVYNSAGSLLTDPQLQAVYNSGGGAGTPLSLGSQPPLDTWCYFVFLDNATDGQVAAWRSLGSDTWNSYARTNDNAGSQNTNTLTFGNNDGGSAVVMGWYAYARARYGGGQTLADWLTYSKSDVTESGDWGFWPLANNTDTGDTSGNSRALTFSGTITSETNPTLDGAPPVAVLSAPTPSGVLGTTTTATVGVTTDQNTGTLYVVADSAASLSGVTKAQIKAGQKASGASAAASGNAAVSTTSPSVGLSGLTASRPYTYAVVQNNTNGDSNIVTGSFTTAGTPTGGGGVIDPITSCFPSGYYE